MRRGCVVPASSLLRPVGNGLESRPASSVLDRDLTDEPNEEGASTAWRQSSNIVKPHNNVRI